MIHATLSALRQLTGREPQAPAGLLTVEQTRRALAVARATADRTSQCLSVVVFEPRAPELAAATADVLGNCLRGRLRITDEAGRLGTGLVCAILPFTPPKGAMNLADDICLLFPDEVAPPICTVHAYPFGNMPPEVVPRDGGTDGKATDATPNRRGRPSISAPTPEPAHVPLEPLFRRPMPLAKRVVDVIVAGLGLAALVPFLPIVALAIKVTSPGPVFFKQRRAGLGGQPFVMWKLRTMVADAEALKTELMARNEQNGPAFKIKRDPRVTTLGRNLRATSIDELPQLWNVLRGDMSLVGPRPLPCGESDKCEPWQRRRLDVVPGLTCIWQVRGRSAVSFDEWVRMDVEYIETQSLVADFRLLLATVPAVVLRKGAS